MAGKGEVVGGIDPSGNPVALKVTADGTLITGASSGALSALGEVLVQQPVPQVQASFIYGIQPSLILQLDTGTGSSATADSVVTVSSGVSAGSCSSVRTRGLGHYDPGLGLEALFEFMFPITPAGTEGWVGLIDEEDGCALGHQAGVLALIHRRGGQRHIATLNITAEASGLGSIDIELNGTTVNVPLAGTETVGEVITEIVAADFSGGGGWQLQPFGSGVSFLGQKADVRSGAYSFTDNGTNVTGAFEPANATGVVPTDDKIPSTAWNQDKADGTGLLPAIDITTLNVGRVEICAGGLAYYIKDPESAAWLLVHMLQWSNANTVPLFGNPTMPLTIITDNQAFASNATAATASMAVHLQGQDNPGASAVFESDGTVLDVPVSAETVVSIYHVKSHFGARTNKLFIQVESLSISNSAGKTVTFKIYLNPQIEGDLSYSSVGIGVWEVAKPAVVDAIVVVPGTALLTLTSVLAAGGSATLPDITGAIPAGSMIVITATTVGGGGGEMTVAPTWRVEF